MRLAARVASKVRLEQDNGSLPRDQDGRHQSVGQHSELNQHSDSEGEEEYRFDDPKVAKRAADRGGAGGVNLANQNPAALASGRKSQKELNLDEVNDFILN